MDINEVCHKQNYTVQKHWLLQRLFLATMQRASQKMGNELDELINLPGLTGKTIMMNRIIVCLHKYAQKPQSRISHL